ncbi:unnamed protein product [Microthlaspi erraticum]|uniref:Retrotransposon gag domain-containing protein n=1 Tax=Microthlaspi erraticum TaxID=1685480 RepID=A0A6D2HUB7_9BRAS|nr:unnamed protein product [Microthlaspi erraticum]
MGDQPLTKADLEGISEALTTNLTALRNQMVALTTQLTAFTNQVVNAGQRDRGREPIRVQQGRNNRAAEPVRVQHGGNNRGVNVEISSSDDEDLEDEEEADQENRQNNHDYRIDVDRFFDVMGVPESKQVKMVAIRLKKTAAVWWDKLVVQRQRQRKGPVKTWRRMKQLMLDRFLPEDYEQILYKMYLECVQGKRTVTEYTAEFTVWTVQEASSLALKAELMEKSTRSFSSFKRFTPQNNYEAANEKEKNVRTVALLGEEEDEEQEFNEDDEYEGVEFTEEESHEKINIVLQRILLSSKDEGQRKNLFRTHSSIQNKVCNVIVDNRSTENLVSQKLVDFLKLPTKEHENPFPLGWIKKGSQVRVTMTCRVPISIGKHYKEKIICDVLDMDVCHVLFGRPWQYDNDI